MSLDISVRLSSKRVAIGSPYEDLIQEWQRKNQLTLEELKDLAHDVAYSCMNSQSGEDRARLEELRRQVDAEVRLRDTGKFNRTTYLTSQVDNYANLFNQGDFVFFIQDAAAQDGSLIGAGSEGQIISKYSTDRQNVVYIVKVRGKDVPTNSDQIRLAMRLSTAGEEPSYVDSATDCPSGPQASPGGDTVRTHSPLSIYTEKPLQEPKWIFNPQTHEWDKVFEKVARLVNGQVLLTAPSAADVSPFSAKLQDLSINYQSNPQGTFNSQLVSNELSEDIVTQEEQQQIEEKQQEQVNEEQQKTAASGDITSPANHDRSQLEEAGDGVRKTNDDIDGPNQTHKIWMNDKTDDDVFDWLPSPFDIGEDGSYRTTDGPKLFNSI